MVGRGGGMKNLITIVKKWAEGVGGEGRGMLLVPLVFLDTDALESTKKQNQEVGDTQRLSVTFQTRSRRMARRPTICGEQMRPVTHRRRLKLLLLLLLLLLVVVVVVVSTQLPVVPVPCGRHGRQAQRRQQPQAGPGPAHGVVSVVVDLTRRWASWHKDSVSRSLGPDARRWLTDSLRRQLPVD